MKYAKKNGLKVEALKSGNIAKCPVCNKDVRAYCGKLIVWHWKHVSKKECDPWWEPETKWHRDWKNLFPEEWQEVTLRDPVTNELHRADIKTDRDIVLEFQNSPISQQELQQRESFYRELVWVVNAGDFKDNFSLESLRSKEYSKLYEYFDLEKDLVYDRIQKLKKEESCLNWTWNYELDHEQKTKELNDKIEDLIEQKETFCLLREHYQNQLAQEIVEAFSRRNSLWDIRIQDGNRFLILSWSDASDFFNEIERKYKDDIIDCFQKQKDSIKSLDLLTEAIQEINNLQVYNRCGKNYGRILDMPFRDYSDFALIYFERKEDFHDPGLFPNDFKPILSEKEFSLLMANEDRYCFFIAMNELGRFEKEKKQSEDLLANSHKELESFVEILTMMLDDWLPEKIEQIEYEKRKVYDELFQLDTEERRFAAIERRMLDELEAKKDLEVQKISNQFEGEYHLKWKHTRRVWLSSECIVFFDTGGDDLFLFLKPDKVKKILKRTFIDQIKAGTYKRLCLAGS